jgi:hypothetical protein
VRSPRTPAACFDDRRDPGRVRHPLADLLAPGRSRSNGLGGFTHPIWPASRVEWDAIRPGVTGIALGYENLTDHDSLRHDPLLKLLGEAKAKGGDRPAPLAGSSTLGRVERSFEDSDRRYHRITAQPNRLQDLYVDLFTESHDTAPKCIDPDKTCSKHHLSGSMH